MLDHIPALSRRRVVLASGSPRRKELLTQIGLKFEVIVSEFDESLPKGGQGGAAYAQLTAACKAADVANMLKQQQCLEQVDMIIGADTVVELDEHILEKPSDASDARRMLQLMSGRSHQVHTGVALVVPTATGADVHRFSASTTVKFGVLSDAAIDQYVASGEPFGKAGSYGIQGMAAAFVEEIDGCYFNVVGFPLNSFCDKLNSLVSSGALPL